MFNDVKIFEILKSQYKGYMGDFNILNVKVIKNQKQMSISFDTLRFIYSMDIFKNKMENISGHIKHY